MLDNSCNSTITQFQSQAVPPSMPNNIYPVILGNDFHLCASSSTSQPYYVSLDPNPEPWTTWNMYSSSNNGQESSDIAFSGYHQAHPSLSADSYNEHQLQLGQVPLGQLDHSRLPSRVNNLTGGLESPPSFNPVGPPPKDALPGGGRQIERSNGKTKGVGRRHGKLRPDIARDAAERRKLGSCWSCRLLKEKVHSIESLGNASQDTDESYR